MVSEKQRKARELFALRAKRGDFSGKGKKRRSPAQVYRNKLADFYDRY